MVLKERFRGMLLGTAVGDAVGLPAEGISKARVARLFGDAWRHRFVFGKGMVSDDTEHTLFVVQCLLAHADAPDRFIRRLAFCLRWWLVSLPAGIGLATARAILKLWIGFPPTRSGVASAGNGPAMRAAPIGAYFAHSRTALEDMSSACTRLTHTDPRADIGARAIAQTAGWIVRENISQQPRREDFIENLKAISDETSWQDIVAGIETACASGHSVADYAASLGQSQGISGYIYHTVPVVLFAWYRHCGDYEHTLTAVWACGGDTDTTGAIAGALAGLSVGEAGIPDRWIEGIVEWPRTTHVMRRMADALASKASGEPIHIPVRYFWPGLVLRNIVFFVVVVLHGLRRLLPPY